MIRRHLDLLLVFAIVIALFVVEAHDKAFK
jgi:hypothetical protein